MCARCKLRAKTSHNPTPVPPKKPYNAELSDERPPLHVAAGKGDVAAVRAMIQAGADINHATDNGMTPLLRAVHEGHDVVVRMLLKAGAELDNTLMDGFTPLYAAAAMGREACARMLIKAGADIHKVSNDGVTPLFIAATRGHVTALRVLIEAGADINAVGEAGTTPLTFAIAQGNEAVVRALIEAGVDLNKSLDDGMFPPGQGVTPLHIAAQGGHQAIAHVLLEAVAVAPRHLWAILEAAGGTAAADVASKPDTPSPSGTSKGHSCLKCGSEATKRCSKCVKRGVFSSYYCGRECQKSDWKAHKKRFGMEESVVETLTESARLVKEGNANVRRNKGPEDDGDEFSVDDFKVFFSGTTFGMRSGRASPTGNGAGGRGGWFGGHMQQQAKFQKKIRLGGSKGREFRSAVVEHVAFVMDGPGLEDQALAHFIKRGADDPLLSALDDDENDSKVRSALTSIGALPLPNGVFVSQGPLLEDTMPGIFDKKE